MTANDDFKSAELRVPIDQTGILPFRVMTLQYIPKDARWLYNRTMSGDFRLARAAIGSPTLTKHPELVQQGVEILSEGTTEESYLEAERERAEHEAVVQRAISGADRRWKEENAERAREAEAARQRRYEQDQDRARRGQLTSEDLRLLREAQQATNNETGS